MAQPVPVYGNIITPPEARFTRDGVQVVTFRMVQDDRIKQGEEWVDREPKLYLTVEAWRHVGDNLAESTLAPGDRVCVRGVLRKEKDYEQNGVTRDGGMKIEAEEVMVSTRNRIVTTRKPDRQGGRPQQGGQPDPWGAPPQQGGQPDPWGASSQQGGQPSQQGGQPSQQGGQPSQQGGQPDPWGAPPQQGGQPSQQGGQPDPWGGV